jgi:hypothetical protein
MEGERIFAYLCIVDVEYRMARTTSIAMFDSRDFNTEWPDLYAVIRVRMHNQARFHIGPNECDNEES